jgi:hypothetical protein
VSEFNPQPQSGTAPPSLGQRFDYLRGFLQRHYLAILLGLVIALPIGPSTRLAAPGLHGPSTMTIESRKGPMDGPGMLYRSIWPVRNQFAELKIG